MTTTFATPAAPQATSDPTAVMGRRVVAWVIDLLIYLALMGGVLAGLAEYKEIDDGFSGDEIEFCEQLIDDNPDFEGNCIAPPFGDRVYLLEFSDSAVQWAVAIGWGLINFVLISSVAGGSVGKLITGLRVVDAQGTRAGIGKHILRLVLWIVDGIPGVPVVGGIAAVTSNGHRRVGDMAAGTYVVGTRSVGVPIRAAAAPAPPGAQPWGASPPTAPPPGPWAPPIAPQSDPTSVYGAAPVPTPTPPRSDFAGDSAGMDPTVVDTPAAEVPPTPSAPDTEPAPDDDAAEEFDPSATVAGAHAPWAPPAEEPSAAQPTTQPPVTPGPTQPAEPEPAPASLPEPRWDEARNTYLQWDPNRGAWLQWDTSTDSWKPIDT